MDRIHYRWIVGAVLLFQCLVNAHAATSPVGYWKSIDPTTGQTKNIIQIWQTKDHTLTGKIIKSFPVASHHAQPILGKVILTGLMAHNENQWKNGNLTDPDSGKTYSCSLHMAENGKTLNVHHYAGIPLFAGVPFLGQSQTWERVDLMSE